MVIIFAVQYSYLVALFITFYVKERVSRAKLLQMISGVNQFVYWLTAFFFDFVIFTAITVVLIGVLAAYQNEGWSTFDELARLLLIVSCFGVAVLPLTYLMSHLFTQASTAETLVLIFGILSGGIFFGIYNLLIYVGSEFLQNLLKRLYYVFLLLPHFNLCDTLYKLLALNSEVNTCADICKAMNIPDSNCLNTVCTLHKECCNCKYGNCRFSM